MMAPSSQPSQSPGKLKIDVLAKQLRVVDASNYDHPDLYKVMKHLGTLDARMQKMIIKTALNVDFTYEDLMEHVRSQFIVLQQKDQDGKYCGLGFGEKCTSVATWDGWDVPKHAEGVDVTGLCYASFGNGIGGSGGELRCGHLLDFAELWMDVNGKSFDEFLDGVNREDGGL